MFPKSTTGRDSGAGGAIVNINDVINRILEIPLPRVHELRSFSTTSKREHRSIRYHGKRVFSSKIRSEDGEIVRRLGDQIGDIAAETSSQTGAEVSFNVLARRQPGGIAFSHPLASHARSIIKALGVNPRISPSTSELSALSTRGFRRSRSV